METIRIIVKSIVVIIIFTALLEIILPRSDMKRYVNLIIGLFVIIAVLNPFLTVLNKGLSFDVLNSQGQSTAADTRDLIQKGQGLAEAQRNGVAREYKDKLSRQIAAMAELYQKKRVSGVDIEMVDDSSSPDFGTVKKVVLHLSNSQDTVAAKNENQSPERVEIDEIRIGPKDSGSPSPAEKSGQADIPGLRDMIANFYGLSPEQIVIEN